MAFQSKIEWTHGTLNFWLGCDKVSPACRLCYIVRQTPLRVRGMKHGDPRQRTAAATWNQAYAWNRKAEKAGKPMLVFANSLSDWLDDEVPIEWFVDMMTVVRETPWITWQLLSKRPENWLPRIQAAIEYLVPTQNSRQSDTFYWLADWREGLHHIPRNIWIGATVENQEMADKRHPLLMKIPAHVHFWSCEPLLSVVSDNPTVDLWDKYGHPDWVITGGESGGPKDDVAPSHPNWFKGLRNLCQNSRVPFFFKQWGDWAPIGWAGSEDGDAPVCWISLSGDIHKDAAPRSVMDTKMIRLGKQNTGNVLGEVWSEMPSPPHSESHLPSQAANHAFRPKRPCCGAPLTHKCLPSCLHGGKKLGTGRIS